MNMKITKGHEKMLLYLNNLIRTEEFKEVLREYSEAKKETGTALGDYESWSDDEKKKHDAINKELGEIIKGYEILRKRCQKILKDKVLGMEKEIAQSYQLDQPLLYYALGLLGINEILMDHFEDEVDMCRLADLADEELHPINKGEEIIYLQPSRQSRLISYPIAIQIHKKASQKDVTDFISKRWPFIDQMRDDKGSRLRRSKRPRDIKDFIWKNRDLPSKKIQEMLRQHFPNCALVYYEISNIIKAENRKRNGILS